MCCTSQIRQDLLRLKTDQSDYVFVLDDRQRVYAKPAVLKLDNTPLPAPVAVGIKRLLRYAGQAA